MEIYRISTTDAAAVWLYRQAHGGVNKEWTVTSYELGDGANMATYVGPINPTQYGLYFRKGRFLAHLGGRSKDSVEHFAQILPPCRDVRLTPYRLAPLVPSRASTCLITTLANHAKVDRCVSSEASRSLLGLSCPDRTTSASAL